jgi:hypothetical protein
MNVFVSFATADHQLVHVLSRVLMDAGITPLVAASRFSPGTSIDDKVRAMIGESDCVVVLYTAAASKSQWVQQEIGCAKALKKDIIALKTRTARIGAMLEGYEYITFSTNDPLLDFGRVASSLRDYAEKKGLSLSKSSEIKMDEFQILHLPKAITCPHCKSTEIHVFLCFSCGDWVCVECGETVPPPLRADTRLNTKRRSRV